MTIPVNYVVSRLTRVYPGYVVLENFCPVKY